MTPESAAALLSTWGYPAYFALFLGAAFGSPLTEDLLLLLGGYLVGTHVFSWSVATPIAYAGVVSTDSILFAFGRRLRSHTLRRGWVRRVIRPGRLRVATRWFTRFGDWTVFAARLVPGTRMVVFVTAGLRGMPLRRFVAYDALASAIYVPVLLSAGARLGERFGTLGSTIDWVADRVLWLAAALLAVTIVRRLWLRRERQKYPSILEEP